MRNLLKAMINSVYDLVVLDHFNFSTEFSAYFNPNVDVLSHVDDSTVNSTDLHSLSPTDITLTATKLPLSEVAIKHEHDLTNYCAVGVRLAVHNALNKHPHYKVSNSLLIFSDEKHQQTNVIYKPVSDSALANYFESLPTQTMFIDKLEQTYDFNLAQTAALKEKLLALKSTQYSVSGKKVSRPAKVQFKYQIEIEDKNGYKIIILIDSFNSNNNDVKTAWNPNKPVPSGMFDVLACFKEALGKDYSSTINTSNVTLIAYTIDLVNVPVSQLYFLLSNGQKSQTFINEEGDIETRIEGTDNFNIKSYNLTNNRIKKALMKGDIELAVYYKTLPLITRIEVEIRSQKSTKVNDCQFGYITDFPLPFDGIKLFNRTELFKQPALVDHIPQMFLLGIHSVLRHKERAEYNRIRRQVNKAQIDLSENINIDQQHLFNTLKKLFATNSKKNFVKYCRQLSSHTTNDKNITGADYD